MDTSPLRRKIRESLEEGYSLDEIREAMLEDNYPEETVDELIQEFRYKEEGRGPVSKDSEFSDFSEDAGKGQEGLEDIPGGEADQEAVQEEENIEDDDSQKGQRSSASDEGVLIGKRRDPPKVAIFTLISLGLYFPYWVYCMFKYSLSLGKDESPERIKTFGVWILSAIPVLNLAVWAYFIHRILDVAETGRKPSLFTFIYIVLAFTGIGAPITAYLLQKDINSALR